MISTYSPDLIPSVCYPNARAGIAFLERAFGFEEHLVVPGPNGTVAHSELRLGRGLVMCGESQGQSAERNWKAPSELGGRMTSGIYVAVPEVDALFSRATGAGAAVFEAPHDTDYGSRDFSVVDPGGHRWGFGTYHPLADRPGGDDSGKGTAPEVYAACRYRNARGALAFLERAFGFEPHFVVPGDGDDIAHAQLRYGSSVFMLGSARNDKYASAAPSDLGGTVTQTWYLAADDPDAHAARAAAAGATIVTPPGDRPHGSRDYAARDPEGYLWFFGTYRPAAPGTP